MSCDKLVFDLSQEVEGSPNIFIRKDWLNILDNQNQNYQGNQSVIDTSQLSNSNKWMSYREAYLHVPLLLNVCSDAITGGSFPFNSNDYVAGLKNWFGSIIHSITVDYNGTTIVQQTPFSNMWNVFKLLTTLSYNDVITQGATIGFFPDTADSFIRTDPGDGRSSHGSGVCNNANTPLEYSGTFSQGNYSGSKAFLSNEAFVASFAPGDTSISFLSNNAINGGNVGLQRRIMNINFNPKAKATDEFGYSLTNTLTYGSQLCSASTCQQTWRSYITQSFDDTGLVNYKQYFIAGTIYLRHLHSFFNNVPLLKGAFMKITLNLNNCDTSVNITGDGIKLLSSSVPVGGCQNIMIPALGAGIPKHILGTNATDLGYTANLAATASVKGLIQYGVNGVGAAEDEPGNPAAVNLYYSLQVGNKNLSSLVSSVKSDFNSSSSSGSILLYVPAYSFNPPFEKAYLSSSPKQVKYTDIYQYPVENIEAGSNFIKLITNGISNIKSVLIVPTFQSFTYGDGGVSSMSSVLSPFDPVGCGTTAPMVTLGNFNIQISGQNAIYNMQRYTFEEFNNQLYGQNAVNGGLTDGLTSGLIDFNAFKNSYAYYYVNVERMLPVEMSVPKSVQIIGTNLSPQTLKLYVFVEYGTQIDIDLYTGARI